MSGADDLDGQVRAGAWRVLEQAWQPSLGYCRPHRRSYPHLWLWDSCFHSIAWSAFRDDMVARVHERLDVLYTGLMKLREEGLPVNVIAPEGAIYLSVQFALRGRTTPEGTRLDGDEAVRAYLLRAAGLAVVPLRAFGSEEDTEWFRLSVGAVSVSEIEGVLPRVRGALKAVSG